MYDEKICLETLDGLGVIAIRKNSQNDTFFSQDIAIKQTYYWLESANERISGILHVAYREIAFADIAGSVCSMGVAREAWRVFFDFGATDGIELSNSYLLETNYGWNGIVAEPAKDWHASLRRNRQCSVELIASAIDREALCPSMRRPVLVCRRWRLSRTTTGMPSHLRTAYGMTSRPCR